MNQQAAVVSVKPRPQFVQKVDISTNVRLRIDPGGIINLQQWSISGQEYIGRVVELNWYQAMEAQPAQPGIYLCVAVGDKNNPNYWSIRRWTGTSWRFLAENRRDAPLINLCPHMYLWAGLTEESARALEVIS
jgi:hypothetical protein